MTNRLSANSSSYCFGMTAEQGSDCPPRDKNAYDEEETNLPALATAGTEGREGVEPVPSLPGLAGLHSESIAATALGALSPLHNFDFAGLAGLNFPDYTSIVEAIESLDQSLETSRLPPNLAGVDLNIEDLSRLADEGIVLWAVPDPETARQFLAASTTGERRVVLSRRSTAILEECESVAAYGAGGPYAQHARVLEQAIAAGRQGFVGPALSHLASVLDTMMWTELEKTSRVQLVRHRPTKDEAVLNHFEELMLQHAMIFRPIWFAYRPMHTTSERALSSSFARHAVAHGVTGRNVISFRNFVQASMLAAALLNFLSWWSDSNTNGASD